MRKTNKYYYILCIFICYGCISKNYIYIQNKTYDNVYIYDEKNRSYLLEPDSMFFLTLIYGKKTKDALVSLENIFIPSKLNIDSNGKCIKYSKKEIIEEVNKLWLHNKRQNNNILIWEIRDSLFYE